MGTAKTSDPSPDASSDADRGTWLAVLRRLKEDCLFDEYRDTVVRSRFADTPFGRLELARLELHREDPDAALRLLDELIKDEPGFAPAAAWRIAALDSLCRFHDAEAAAIAALDRHPDSVDVHVATARLHMDRGRDAEAKAAIDAALDLDPASVSTLIWRTRILSSSDGRAAAERSAREALAVSPSDQRLLMELGWLLWEDDRAAEALTVFDRVLELDSSHARALEWRVTALRALFRRDEAEAAVHAAIGLRPSVPALHVELGLALEDQGRDEDALAAVDHAISLCPSRRRSVGVRIRLLRKLRRWPEAEDTARSLVDRLPHSPNAWVNLGWLFHSLGRFDDALAAFDRALAIDGRDSSALGSRIDSLRALRLWDEAETAARVLIAEHPNDPMSALNLGWVYDDQDRDEEALAAFEQALAVDDRHTEALKWKAITLRALRRWDDAEAAARDLVSEHPNDPAAHLHLGLVFYDQDRDTEALAACERALALDDRDETALDLHIDALRALRRWDEAEAAARDFVAKHPNNPTSHTSAGWVLYGRGRFDDALAAFDRALALDDRDGLALRSRIDALRAVHRWADAEATGHDLTDRHPTDPASYLSLGLVFYDQDRYAEALAAYERALAVDARNEQATRFRIDALRALRRWDDAETTARGLIAGHPNDPIAHINLGWVFYGQDRFDDALTAFDQALALDDRNLRALQWKTITLRALRRWDDAEAAARDFIAKHPDDPASYRGLGLVFYDQDRDAEALAAYDQAMAVDDRDGVVLASRIDALRALRRWDQAEAAARDFIAKHPEDPGSYRSLGLVFFDQDRDEEAVAAYDQALAIDGRNVHCLISRIDSLRALRRWDEAEAAARDLVAEYPDDPDSHVNLAWVFYGRTHYDDALAACEQALALAGRHRPALLTRIDALRALRRWDQAEAAARDLVVQRPDDADSHVNLGWVLSGQDRDEEALAAYEAAVAAQDTHFNALVWRVRGLRALRRWTEAEAAARDLVAKHPRNPVAYLNLGWVHYDQDRDDKALDAFDEALETNPGHKDALAWKIIALRSLDRLSEAETVARRALAIHPRAPELHIGLGRVFKDRELYETALTHADRALQIAPTFWDAHSFHITCLIDVGRFADAERAARDYVAEYPQAVPARIRLAEILDSQHRYEESLAEYERVQMMDRHNSAAASGISATLRSLRCFGEAEAHLRSALERDPRDTALLINLGLVYVDQRDLKGAVEVFEGLLRNASGSLEAAGAHYGLGWAALADDRFGEAAAHFDDMTALIPAEAEGFVAKAWALMRIGGAKSLDEAETICRTVLRKHPHSSMAHTCLGMIAYHRDEFSIAERHFRRCIDLSPYDGCHVDLGALYTQLGRYEEAESSLRRAIELNPWDPQARVKLGSLFLQRSDRLRSSDTGADDVEAACIEFRRVLAANPRSGAAALGLAVALASHKSGDLSAAEDVLRAALHADVTDIPAWQLRLALARLLIQVGDASQQSEPYDAAALEAVEAIKKAANEAEPYFVAGIAEQRLAGQTGNVRLRVLHQRRAQDYFGKCVERSPEHSEANHALRLLKQQKAMARAGDYRGAVVVGTACLLLAAMWVDFLWKHHVTAVMITTLTPVLIGLMAIGLILPLLIRLKLPGGMEADLSASLDVLSAGPPGHIVINAPRLPPLASPSGQLPRLNA